MSHRRLAEAVPAGLLIVALLGCGSPETPSLDPKPFEAAVADYFEANNMGMAIREIKAGPTVDGSTANLTASCTRADVGGPNVTWTFRFEQTPDGSWKAVGHEK